MKWGCYLNINEVLCNAFLKLSVFTKRSKKKKHALLEVCVTTLLHFSKARILWHNAIIGVKFEKEKSICCWFYKLEQILQYWIKWINEMTKYFNLTQNLWLTHLHIFLSFQSSYVVNNTKITYQIVTKHFNSYIGCQYYRPY